MRETLNERHYLKKNIFVQALHLSPVIYFPTFGRYMDIKNSSLLSLRGKKKDYI